MSQHTPGPWRYIGDGLTHRQFSIYAPAQSPQQHVCTVNDLPVPILWQRDADQALANAKLIAAAPDLIKALQAALEWGAPFKDAPRGSRPDWFAQAAAAVESATGGAR